jgi:hypothetical protein
MNQITLERQSQSPMQILRRVDWLLLGFLLLFTLDSVVAKPVAIGLGGMFLLPRLKSVKFRDTPLFYLLLPTMEVLRFFLLNKDFSAGHIDTLIIGCVYWIMAWLGFVFVRDRVENKGWEQVSTTLDVWFLINAAFSVFQLLMTVKNSGTINPYASHDLRYGNSSGDYIRGILLGPSYFNMFINSFFAVWYLFRKKWILALLACLICCLATANFANIIFLPVLLMLLFVLKTKAARFCILGCVALFVCFNVFVSRGNLRYLGESMNDSAVENFDFSKPIPGETDSMRQKRWERFLHYRRFARPNGKRLSWTETWDYFKSSPQHALIGAGMGNFSSLLALRMAHVYGREHSRFYERMPVYVHPAYRDNHLEILQNIYALPEAYHSTRHMPHSFPNQLVGEYGLIGVLCFLFGYVWFFLKRVPLRGYFAFMFLLTAGYLWFDYLFEYLSVMVFFEMFFLIYRSQAAKTYVRG